MIDRSKCIQPAKNTPNNAIADGTTAVAHDNDLQLIEDMVRPSQYAEFMPKIKQKRAHEGFPQWGCSREHFA
jgi:hypothetical protein